MATSFQVFDLDEDTTYYWRVSMTSDSSVSSWSDVRSLRTGRVPAQVFLLGPDNGAVVTSDSALMSWHQSQFEVDRYWIELATDSLFTGSMIDSTVADTARVVSPLQHYTTYWWRVRAHNPVGWGEFSEVREFFTYFTALPPPVLLSPPDRAINLPATVSLVWRVTSPVLVPTDTVRYHFQFARDIAFDSLLVNDSTLVDTTTTVGNLLEGTVYFWRVQAKDSFSTSPWSEHWRFRTLPPLPSQVTSLSPDNGSAVLADSIRILWRQGVPETDRYWLELATDSTFSNAITDSSIIDTTTVVHDLAHQETYYWRVRAHNASGWGPPGSVWNFLSVTHAPTSPDLVSPADQTSNELLTVAFVWQTVNPDIFRQAMRDVLQIRKPGRHVLDDPEMSPTDSLAYHLQIARDAGFQDLVENDSLLVDTTDVVSSFSPNTTYYWRVRASNLFGSGNWSAIWRFTTLAFPAQIVLDAPEDEAIITDVNAVCRWFPGTPLVDRYWFEWTEDSTFAVSEIDTSGIDTTFIASPLQNGQSYYWRARGHNTLGWGEFSDVWSFSVLITSVEPDEEIPAVFSLSQNYPNPFNPSTRITYGLPQQAHVTLEIFTVLGERVEILVDESQEAGYHDASLNLRGFASGIYLYRLQAGDFVQTRKLLLVK